MKKIFLILLLCGYILPVASQTYSYLPFVEKSSVWTEFRGSFCGGGYWDKFSFGNDTTIKDTVWTKLINTYTSTGEFMCNKNEGSYQYGLVYEDVINKKVWLKTSSINLLLRDYNGTIGDTLRGTDYVPDNLPFFWEKITMDTVVEMNGLRMRKLNDHYFEGLGYLGIFENNSIIYNCIDCISGDIVCYERDGKIIYQNPAYTSCWPETVSTAQVGNEETALVASPLRGTSLVRTAGFDLLRLVSASGSELLRIPLQGADMYSLDASSFPAGNYILVLSRADGSSVRQTVQVVR